MTYDLFVFSTCAFTFVAAFTAVWIASEPFRRTPTTTKPVARPFNARRVAR